MALGTNSKLTVSLLVLILAAYGFVLSIGFKSDANAVAIKELTDDQKEDRRKAEAQNDLLHQISADVKVIRNDVDRIRRKIRD